MVIETAPRRDSVVPSAAPASPPGDVTGLGNVAGPDTPLPYGPFMTRLLEPLRRGFLLFNGSFMVPGLRSGFGLLMSSPMTGHLMLLRTRGRRSGLPRDVPLGYVIRDGAVYCVAGYGVRTPWYLNLLDTPTVEVVLPGRRFRGVAEPVTDDTEWIRTYRALIKSFGVIGRLTSGDLAGLDDTTVLAAHRSLPVVRIRRLDPPGPIQAGAWDPGGRGWLVSHGLLIAGLLAARRIHSRGVRRAKRAR
jgi:deazaflavin-dependent oxidoreductase (nitroreductase family)